MKMNNTTNDDIKYAQRILEGTISSLCSKNSFHKNSFIYKFSNENVAGYYNYLIKKNDSLQVISSGDQILNSVLAGNYNIDGFDISAFPKYFLNLKIAAIKTVDKSDFINFFIDDTSTNGEYYDDLYSAISKELDKDNKKFWDSLFNFYDWYEIYNSELFSKEPFNTNSVIERNKYLQDDNYLVLRDKLNNLNLNTYNNDIIELVQKLRKKYNLINLSNIIYYVSLKSYKKILDNICLTDNGICLSYLYEVTHNMEQKINSISQSNNIYLDNIQNSNSKVLIYKKC